MWKAVVVLVLAIIALGQPCFAQLEVLVWSDEFDGTGVPDAANWSYDIGNNGWGNNEIQNYTNLLQNVRQENGNLVIEALKSGNVWTSARIISLNKAEFTYGRMVFRAKLPEGSGTWPALWMLGEDISTAGWPACGEIDVMEHVGKDPGVVHCALHTPSSSGNTVNKKTTTVSTFATEFHEYQVQWSPEKISFLVDGSWYYTYNPAVKNSSTWPFEKPFFFIMNIAMGGNFGSDPQYETNGLKNGIDPALTSARMEVDFVRVYQTTTAVEETDSENIEPNGIKIFPNPSSGIFTLRIPDEKTGTICIRNLLGEQVFQSDLTEKNTGIDLSEFPKGIYYFQVTLEKKKFTGKVLLQ
jgi:beta-glucanase (GH16 family)